LTAHKARDDSPNNEQARCSNAHQRGSDQQRNPDEAENYHDKHKSGKADRPRRGNLNAKSVALAS
jgi:hypothetical protein